MTPTKKECGKLSEKTLVCPKCGADMPHKKKWKLHGRGKHEITIHLHRCINPDCGATLRYKGDP